MENEELCDINQDQLTHIKQEFKEEYVDEDSEEDLLVECNVKVEPEDDHYVDNRATSSRSLRQRKVKQELMDSSENSEEKELKKRKQAAERTRRHINKMKLENPEKFARMVSQKNERERQKRAAMTDEERAEWRAKCAENMRLHCARMSDEQKMIKNMKRRKAWLENKQNPKETPEEKELERQRAVERTRRYINKMKLENPEKFARMVSQKNEHERQKRAAMTDEERAEWRAKCAENMRLHCARLSNEQKMIKNMKRRKAWLENKQDPNRGMETPEEKELKRQQEVQKTRRRRIKMKLENPEKYARMLSQNNESKRLKRAAMTDEERAELREKEAERKRLQRARKSNEQKMDGGILQNARLPRLETEGKKNIRDDDQMSYVVQDFEFVEC